MKILALEFSSIRRSVALVDEKAGLMGQASEFGGRSVHGLSLITAALEQARVRKAEIDCIAVGLGPGSYTGIRAAIALGQGWQLARGIQLLGVSSVEATVLAAQCQGWFGRVNIVIDAQRNEFCLSQYAVDEIGYKPLQPLRLAQLAEIAAFAAQGELVVGPEVDRWFKQGRVLFPTAECVGKLAQRRKDFVAGEALEPLYSRPIAFQKTEAVHPFLSASQSQE